MQLFRDISRANVSGDKWDIIGLLDDNPDTEGKIRNGVRVLGNRQWLSRNHRDEYFYACCIGKPSIKKEVVEHLDTYGVQYATAIHPSVVISETSKVGEGTLITAGCIVTTNVRIGRHVIVNLMCTISHNTIVGDYCTINPGARVNGDIIIQNGVYIGTSAAILDKLTIGADAIIGGGALVHRNVLPGTTVAGVPAQVINSSRNKS